MEKGTTVAEAAVNMVQPRKTHLALKSNSKNVNKEQHGQVRKPTQCFSCGGDYPHHPTTYPAKGSTCDARGKKYHFAKYCRTKPQSNKTCDVHVKAVHQDTDRIRTGYGQDTDRIRTVIVMGMYSVYIFLYTNQATKAKRLD